MRINELFVKMSKRASSLMGSSPVFAFVFCITLGWVIGGVVRYGFGSGYQMWLNTFSSISTMLMAFLIANNQNRESRALQLKLDELLHSDESARKCFIGLEERSDEEIDKLAQEFEELHKKGKLSQAARQHLAPIS